MTGACMPGRVHHIKMESTLPTPLERPLALAREFDLMSGWNPYVKDSSLLYAPTIWQSWVYAALWMPFPFPQIDTLATGRGYDLSEASLCWHSVTWSRTSLLLLHSCTGRTAGSAVCIGAGSSAEPGGDLGAGAQEDRSLLVAMESVTEAELPAGSQPIPAQAKRRKRATVVKGSSLRLEALPPGPGTSSSPPYPAAMFVVLSEALPYPRSRHDLSIGKGNAFTVELQCE